MGRHNNNERKKRKKNSSSGDETGLERKAYKKGGPGEGRHKETSESDSDGTLNVSEILNRANSILFDDQPVFQDMDKNAISPSSSSSAAAAPASTEQPTNADLMKMLKSMNDKLKKLDVLEEKVKNVEGEIKKLWLHVCDCNKEIRDKCIKLDDRLDNVELREGQKESRLHKLEEANANLKDSISYLQSQSMRNNLVFGKIPEIENEKPADTERALRKFMVENLKLAQEQVDHLTIERAHRMGTIRRTQQGDIIARNVVCKFNLYKDRETVRQKRTELKGTDFFINEQFPPEVVAKRKRLIPHLKKARDEDKRAWISYDRLYVDGKQVLID